MIQAYGLSSSPLGARDSFLIKSGLRVKQQVKDSISRTDGPTAHSARESYTHVYSYKYICMHTWKVYIYVYTYIHR